MKTLWRLLSYARPYWRGLLLIALTMALTVALDVLRPWPTKLLVDHVLGNEPLTGPLADIVDRLGGAGGAAALLFWACAGTVLIYASRAVVGMVNSAASVTLGQRMVYSLAADVFGHCQRHSLVYHSRR